MFSDLGVALVLFLLLLAALETGFRLGRRAGAESAVGAQVGVIQGAMLGLLGLLLAFSFSAAGNRFMERQDLITTEANAIGTATLRADLLSQPHRAELRQALRDYTAHRLEASDNLREGVSAEQLAQVDAGHNRIWKAAMDGVIDRPITMVSVLPPVNDVIDLHTTRVVAGKKRLPPLVLGVLLSSALLSMSVLGYGWGLARSRRPILTFSITLMVSATLWITYDLDHPRSGLLQLSDAPLRALRFDEAQISGPPVVPPVVAPR